MDSMQDLVKLRLLKTGMTMLAWIAALNEGSRPGKGIG
jgi:hypothetical protein